MKKRFPVNGLSVIVWGPIKNHPQGIMFLKSHDFPSWEKALPFVNSEQDKGDRILEVNHNNGPGSLVELRQSKIMS